MSTVCESIYRRLVALYSANNSPVECLCLHAACHIIGRAARRSADLDRFKGIECRYRIDYGALGNPAPKTSIKSYLKSKLGGARVPADLCGRLLFPVPSDRLKTLTSSICESKKEEVLLFGYDADYPECCIDIEKFVMAPFGVSLRRAIRFASEINSVFKSFGLALDRDELAFLKQKHICNQIEYHYSKSALRRLHPKAIVVHADNHPPHQTYVLAAQSLGIPSIMLQHGLDCEVYALDEAYADHIMLWGEQRLRRYRDRSVNQNFKTTIVGSLEHGKTNEYKSGNELDRDKWVWVTRPHGHDKCYTVNRWPDEGELIFQSIVDVMKCYPSACLVVKPHPYEGSEHFQKEIKKMPDSVCSRISFDHGPIEKVIEGAGIVFTEDSSAGLDAMLQGKLMVQVHFCEDLPAVPYADAGAALFAGNYVELREAIDNLICCSEEGALAMRKAQQLLIKTLIGNQDGCSINRALNVLNDYL